MTGNPHKYITLVYNSIFYYYIIVSYLHRLKNVIVYAMTLIGMRAISLTYRIDYQHNLWYINRENRYCRSTL